MPMKKLQHIGLSLFENPWELTKETRKVSKSRASGPIVKVVSPQGTGSFRHKSCLPPESFHPYSCSPRVVSPLLPFAPGRFAPIAVRPGLFRPLILNTSRKHVNYEEDKNKIPMNKPYNFQNTNICNSIFHISFFKALLINEGEITRGEQQ
jgi:hypothetical protein